ncbi:BsuBI/PstI family type II restriction endonuclease [Flavobacterium beibuense]|nr:BsuBI/PstI family type II restriction endonuclease [Flavobacterium beibuense]
MEIQLPPYISRDLILERLPIIFPEGTANRNYVTRTMAASTIFTMLYIGAVDGNSIYAGPKHVYRMTEEQAVLQSNAERLTYGREALKKGTQVEGTRWYADNTREPIRDETLREGLQQVGAVLVLQSVATTSSRPRYALQREFSELFDPGLTGEALTDAITNWQEQNLTANARLRISLARRTSGSGDNHVLVRFPNGEARRLSTGASSDISKAVIEVFASSFLENPAVLWLSTSDAKVPYLDESLANDIGLRIQPDRDLPDIILADVRHGNTILIFVEVVATDGAITQRRKDAIYALTDAAGFMREHIAFLTAYHDRQKAGFKKTIIDLAWGSFVWFVSEPDKIVHFREGDAMTLTDMMR